MAAAVSQIAHQGLFAEALAQLSQPNNALAPGMILVDTQSQDVQFDIRSLPNQDVVIQGSYFSGVAALVDSTGNPQTLDPASSLLIKIPVQLRFSDVAAGNPQPTLGAAEIKFTLIPSIAE